jgi:phospholipid/cholesterol/gamma-HCH transport system permease protein
VSAGILDAAPERRRRFHVFPRVLWIIGSTALEFFATFGAVSRLTGQTLAAGLRRPFEFSELLRQLYSLGVQSISIGFLTALFTGAVMALQFGWGLERFGASNYVGKVISVGFVMELGPVLTALLVGGRVGAGITAELGSMNVTEQIDAIRALGADPVKKLVVPRVLACTIAMPVLALMADVVGIFGGMLVAVAEQGLTSAFYMDQVLTTVDIGEVNHGLVKSVFFGYFFGILGCFMGLQTRGGTEGVGRFTTRTVVITSITILIGDFVLGKVLLPFTD